jgi:hypothetical protein
MTRMTTRFESARSTYGTALSRTVGKGFPAGDSCWSALPNHNLNNDLSVTVILIEEQMKERRKQKKKG